MGGHERLLQRPTAGPDSGPPTEAAAAVKGGGPVAGSPAPVPYPLVGRLDDPAEADAEAVAVAAVAVLRRRATAGSDADHDGAPGAGASTGAAGGTLDGAAAAEVEHSRASSGRPLSPALRRTMQSALGADLSAVRVHTGGVARRVADRVGADAFTLGKDVFFRDGLPDVDTDDGAHLLAHELQHTVQDDTALHRAPTLAERRAALAQAQARDRQPVPSGPRDAVVAPGTVASRAQVFGAPAPRAAEPAPPVADPAPPVADPGAKAHQARLLAQLKTGYARELVDQNPELVEVVRATALRIRLLKVGIDELKNAPGDLAVVARVVDPFMGQPLLSGLGRTLRALPPDELLAGMTTRYDAELEKARRQELPIDADGNLDDAALAGRMVSYDTDPAAQARTLVEVRGGRLQRSQPPGTPVDTAGSVTAHSGLGVEIFVVGRDGDLHMASHKIGKYHHSSLLAGGDVAMGGEMKVTAGRIDWLSDKSGHYRPSDKHLRQFLHHLRKRGVDLGIPLKGFAVQEYLTANGLPPNTAVTCATFLDTAGPTETFDFVKTEAIFTALWAEYGEAAVRGVLADEGWQTNAAGTALQRADGSAVPHKEVRKKLEAKLGRARRKRTQDQDPVGGVRRPPAVSFVS